MSLPTVPESLVDRIRAGRVAIVVGVGIGVPSWRELLQRMNQRLAERESDDDGAAGRDVAELLDKRNLTRATGFLARTLGRAECDRLIAELWASPEGSTDVARALARVPIRHVWTTFPGDLLETAMAAERPEGWPESEPLTYLQAAEISPRKRTLVKILGDFESFVVTSGSVRQALAGADALRDYMRDLYTGGTLVFVGFRYDDPDLSALLDRVFGAFELPENHHYFVGSELGPVVADELLHDHHIEVIAIDGDEDDEQQALVAFLDALTAACMDAGVSLVQTLPDDDDLEGWLGVWDDDPELAREMLIGIEQAARGEENVERLIDALVGRVEHEDAAATRAGLLVQLAEVFENQVGDTGQAFTALTAAIRENPGDTRAVGEAERLAGEIDGWAELISDVAEVAGELPDGEVAAGYWARLGHWYQAHTDHPDYAIAAFRQAIKLDPGLSAGHEGLEEMLRKQQQWAELADALGEHARVESDNDRKIEVYLALGDLCENQLASTARAVEAYEASAVLDEENDDALAALARLHNRDERWGKLVEVLARRATLLDSRDPGRAAAVRRRIAGLEVDKLGDVEGAIARYEAAVAADPNDLDALIALETLYEKVGRSDEYLRTLERHVDAAGAADKPMLLLRLAAEVEEREPDRAVGFYERIVALEEAGTAGDDGFRALVRLHSRAEAWPQVVATLERHIAATGDRALQVTLHGQLAEVYENRLEDPDSALVAWLGAYELERENRAALAGLARLHERTGAWRQAVAVLCEHAQLEGSEGAALWQRAGALLTDHAGDVDEDEVSAISAQAEAHLEKALELDPEQRDAMLTLARLNRGRQRWGSAVEALLRAERHTSNRLERVAILIEAAELCERELHDTERTLALRRQVLDIDPDHVEMGRRVAERLLADENWAEAQPILEMLARKGDGAGERGRAEHALGQVLERQGELDAAIEHFRLAVAADGDNPDAALALARALFARAKQASNEDEDDDTLLPRWDEVDTHYREFLAHHREHVDDAEVTAIWHDLGLTARALGADEKARDALRRALELDPGHRDSLTTLVDVAKALDDHQTAIDCKRALLAQADEAEQQRLHVAIGDLLHDKLGDPQAAQEAYQQALAMEPDSHVLMHKQLELHTELGEWRRAIDTLDKLAAHDDSARRRGKYHYTAGVIARDKLEDAELAVDRFELALTDDPDEERAFVSLVELLTDAGNFRKLARAYRRMLERLGPDAEVDRLLPLWTRLAEIYADELGDTEAAIAATEVVAALEPESGERREQLADLYLEASDTHSDDAISELQRLLQNHPERIELYRALSNLYQQSQQHDRAYCMARALVFLGAANDTERERFETLRPSRLVVAERRMTDELWTAHVVHGDENRQLSAIFAALTGAIAATTARSAADHELRESERAEVGREARRVVARVFKYVSDILALDPEPHLYIGDEYKGIEVLNTREGSSLLPSVVVGEPHSSIKDDRMLAFEVGKRLAYLRPERYINYILGGSLAELESTYTAILWATGTSTDKPTGDAAKMGKHLKKIVPGAVLDQVGAVAARLVELPRARLVADWQAATELTANRVGLLLCNDLEIAARLIATDGSAMTTLSAKDRLRDLLAYSVSESYFAMREHLRLTVGDGRDTD